MPIEQTSSLTIASGQGDYDVVFADSLAAIAAQADTRDSFAVIDERVFACHPALSEYFERERTYLLPATEEEKTLQGAERLCKFLQAKNATKRSGLIIIGGGITQDIGTFAAHVYYRGIPFVYVPTTLLAMSDSCIGAKCAVNLGAFKNQLGFFQSPTRVAIWTGFLETLPKDDLRSGFGEIVKLAIISGMPDFQAISQWLDSGGIRMQGVTNAIVRSLETKRRIIEQDEYESGLRKILNYGHTFGHALESLTNHEVPHGLAVAWGMDVANFVASQRDLLPADVFANVHGLLARHFATTIRSSYTAARLVSAMGRDKKAAGDTVTLILPSAIGDIRLVPTKLDAELQWCIERYLENYDIFKRAV